MAKFADAQLSVTVNPSDQSTSFLIKGAVLVNPADAGAFILECLVVGDAPLIDDDHFQYHPGGFITGGLATSFPFEFDSTGLLHEDVTGRDEIYASLVLREGNKFGPVVSQIKTNTVQISA
jgi:hypothetical protein